MVKISFDSSFKLTFSKIKDNPEIGKPMKYVRK